MTIVDLDPRRREARHRAPGRYADTPREEPSVRVSGTTEAMQAEWLTAVAVQAVELLQLRPGWAGAGSRPVERRLLQTTMEQVLPLVMPAYTASIPPQLVPTREGGLQLEWHREGWDVEIALSPMGGVWVDCERVDGTESWDGPLADNLEPFKVVLKEVT